MKFKRREFIAAAGVLGGAILARRYVTGGITSIAPPSSDLQTKEVTPNNEFYITQYGETPKIEPASWRLKVTGEVERELRMGLDDINKLPQTTDFNTLICIGNGIGGNLIGNAKWTGVRLRDILEMAGLKDSARDLALHGADGYIDSFPIERALNPDARLVHEMNDKPLPQIHGFPLRAVVPGLYGIKNVKWIERIDVSAEDVRGYWQKRGWSKEGIIKVMSRIDVPRKGEVITQGIVKISGIAFAGEYPITKVELSTDGGRSWEIAKLKPPLSRYAWTLWRLDWLVPGPGEYEIASRATDESGRTQEEGNLVSRRSFPDGADGYHKVKVKAVLL